MTDYRPQDHTHDAAPVKNATEARQGSRGKPMLYVLFGGIALVAAAFAVIYATSSVDSPPPSVGQQTESTPSAGGAEQPEGSRIDLPPNQSQQK